MSLPPACKKVPKWRKHLLQHLLQHLLPSLCSHLPGQGWCRVNARAAEPPGRPGSARRAAKSGSPIRNRLRPSSRRSTLNLTAPGRGMFYGRRSPRLMFNVKPQMRGRAIKAPPLNWPMKNRTEAQAQAALLELPLKPDAAPKAYPARTILPKAAQPPRILV